MFYAHAQLMVFSGNLQEENHMTWPCSDVEALVRPGRFNIQKDRKQTWPVDKVFLMLSRTPG